jgi:6-phosphogluconolactonase/glucosamine-6-phosphate isomerase/deaminase
MSKHVFVFDCKEAAVAATAEFILDWCAEHPGAALGGATGRSPIGVWEAIWSALAGPRRAERRRFLERNVVFLDEYFGAYPAYYHWAYRNLRQGAGGEVGFAAERVFTPRGAYFENGRIVAGSRLEEILADWPEDWQSWTLPGEDGTPPEVRIQPGAEHPVLAEIRQSLDDYDRLVRDHGDRLQLLGIGVGGAIAHDLEAGGHIGFVEYGAADGDSRTMLVRLAPSTIEANRDDFLLTSSDGAVRLEPSSFAVSQGISTILSAGRLLLLAWGAAKQEAVSRMFLGEPGPKNPAAWIQTHPAATIFMDRGAFGELDRGLLHDRGWSVAFDAAPARRV